jgi:hypothetical protein
MNDYTILGSAEFIEAFQNAMRQEILNYYNGLNQAYSKTPSESFKNKSTEAIMANELQIEIINRSGAYGHSRIYRYRIGGEVALRFEQIPFPECCGIAIIKNFSANSDLPKADFLDAMDQFLADIKKNDKYSKVLFYTNAGSNGDRMFSMIDGITILDPFKNRRSGNVLVGFEIDLLEKSDNSWRSMDLGDDEDIDEEHDEDEEEEPSEAVDEIRRMVDAQATLDGLHQPVVSQRPEVVQVEEPALRNGRVDQIRRRSLRDHSDLFGRL